MVHTNLKRIQVLISEKAILKLEKISKEEYTSVSNICRKILEKNLKDY